MVVGRPNYWVLTLLKKKEPFHPTIILLVDNKYPMKAELHMLTDKLT